MSRYWQWQPYVPVAERRREVERETASLRAKGRTLAPVVINGRKITRTFWGTAWCKNLESYSDYENRLPRGRTYVRQRRVLHLEIAAGSVKALVRGSSLYEVTIGIAPVPQTRWRSICSDSAGAIDSLVELLQGEFSTGVMERLCRQQNGLFPAPGEITLECSCPDWASMCKHVAAVLYGIGARLDEQPELLFRLRNVDEGDLITNADGGARLAKRGAAKGKVLSSANLAELFGLPMAAKAASGRKKGVPKAGVRKQSVSPKKKTTLGASEAREARKPRKPPKPPKPAKPRKPPKPRGRG